MTPEKRAAAIAWLQDEIRSLRLAPTINGCGPEPWAEQLEIMQTCLEAVKVCSVDSNKTSPLTLEQLREMDGQPVWVDSVKQWGIVDTTDKVVALPGYGVIHLLAIGNRGAYAYQPSVTDLLVRAEALRKERDEARQDCAVAEHNHMIEVDRRRAAEARCETLEKMVKEYQEELIPGYRERAERAEEALGRYVSGPNY